MMKISEEDVMLTKNLYLSKAHSAQKLSATTLVTVLF